MLFMISQPMRGLTSEEILDKRDTIRQKLEAQGHEVINTYFSDYEKRCEPVNDVANKPLYYLSKSLELMSKCDGVYFCKGWANTRGCRIEYQTANEYGLAIVEESED